MAEFEPAYTALRHLEGAPGREYSNDPDDPGGETYAGISRVHWPQWGGWEPIDALKKQSGFPASLERPAMMDVMAKRIADFYHENFWLRCGLDKCPDQALADEVFEEAVNLGINRAMTFLQKSLNALNLYGKRWPDISVDGQGGPATRAAIAACHARGKSATLRKAVNCLQGAYYIESKNEKYTDGWLSQRT